MGSMFSLSWSDLAVTLSRSEVFVMNLKLLFWTTCSLSIWVLDSVLSGTVGYMSLERMSDL